MEIETKTNKPIVNLRLVAISFIIIDIIKPKIKEKIRVPIHGIFNMFFTIKIEIALKRIFLKVLSKIKTIKEMVIKNLETINDE